MNACKATAIGFAALGVILSHVMFAHVAFCYSDMLWGIQYAGYSAPADTAFLLAMPYLAGVFTAFAAAFIFYKKSRKSA